MASQIKGPGRPATGKGTPVTVRLDEPLLEWLDAFRSAAGPRISRPEGIRILMKMKADSIPPSKERRVADLLQKSRRRHGLAG